MVSSSNNNRLLTLSGIENDYQLGEQMKCVNVRSLETANFQTQPKSVDWLSEDETLYDWKMRVYATLGNGREAQQLMGKISLAYEVLVRYRNEG